MTMARRINVSTMSLFVLLVIASFYETSAEGAGGDELGLFREWLTSGRLSPSTSVALSSSSNEADVDDDAEMTSSESSLGREGGTDDQRLLYLLADEENNGRRTSSRRDDVISRAWADWLEQKRGTSDVKASASKRSPSCMRKCLSQGYLHPAQCHSLC